GAGGAGLPSGARIHGDDHRRAMVAGDVTRGGRRACAGGHDERDGQRKAAPQLHVALTDRCSLRRMRSMRAKWMADPPNMTTPIHPHAKSWNTATKSCGRARMIERMRKAVTPRVPIALA